MVLEPFTTPCLTGLVEIVSPESSLHPQSQTTTFESTAYVYRCACDDPAVLRRLSRDVMKCLLPECQHLVELTAIDNDRADFHFPFFVLSPSTSAKNPLRCDSKWSSLCICSRWARMKCVLNATDSW
jgi:hypothetical protein